MSNSYTIGNLFSMYYENEFSSVEDIELPDFSAQHKRKMKKAFRMFDRNKKMYCNAYSTSKVQRSLSLRKKILIAVMIVVFLAVATGCVVAFVTNSFRGTVYSDNTHVFAFDSDDGPDTIEQVYQLKSLPDNYTIYSTDRSDKYAFTIYKNDNKELVFTQTVKSEFNPHINTENYTFKEIKINGCDGICYEYIHNDLIDSLVIWNNQSYILELEGNFTKDELVELANINEVEGLE